MKTLKFKTNINCGGCIASVTPTLNSLEGIEKWEVDINDPNKLLEIKTDVLNESDIIKKLANIGFKAEFISN